MCYEYLPTNQRLNVARCEDMLTKSVKTAQNIELILVYKKSNCILNKGEKELLIIGELLPALLNIIDMFPIERTIEVNFLIR